MPKMSIETTRGITIILMRLIKIEPTEVINLGWEKASEANHYIITDGEGITEDLKITFSEDKKQMTLYEYEDETGFYAIVYERQ